MKIIGKLEGGDWLVEMTVDEFQACVVLGRGVVLADQDAVPAKHLTQRRKDPKENLGSPGLGVKDNPKKRSRQGPKQAGPVRDKRCAVCGKSFQDRTRTNTRKFCSAECAKNHDRARRSKQAQPIRAPDRNPSDPALTDDERKALRLEMIRKSATRPL